MRIKALPRSRIQLLQTLEEELGLTGACLASYICFKSEAMQLIYAYNYGNVHEEENLETQSSLADDESMTGGNDLVEQPPATTSLSEPRGGNLQGTMDVDTTSDGHPANDFASSIDPHRINDRL